MKILLGLAAILVLVLGGAAVYLAATTPSVGGGVPFPLPTRERALLSAVPVSAESFALVPGVAGVEAKMSRNAVTRDAAARFAAEATLPLPWMIGGADLVIWRSGRVTTCLLQLDPVRALVARAYLALARGGRSTRVLLDAPEGPALPAEELDRVLMLAAELPPGDALVVQREGARGSFPPIARPAVSSIAISATTIDIVSRSPGRDEWIAGDTPLRPRFARGSMLTAAFATPPRVLGDMNRLVGAKVSPLLRDGGAIVIYGVDAGKLLPRPHEVLVMPATPERRAELQRFTSQTLPRGVTEAVGFRIETGEADDDLLVAFDGDSIGRYRKDGLDAAQLPANVWSLRIDPRSAGPVLDRLASNPGLRYLAPRVHRAVRDAAGWMTALRSASSVEAGLVRTAGTAELRVRITSK